MSAAKQAKIEADTLVVFGITGDLARKMTLRSLYRLERRGLLDCRIVGVAVEDWTLEHLRDHAREAIEASGEKLDRARLQPLRCAPVVCERRLQGPGHIRSARARAGRGRQPRVLSGDPAVAVRHGRAGARRRGGAARRARARREAVRSRPRLGARAVGGTAPLPEGGAALPHRSLPRQDGPRRAALPALRQLDARAGVEPQLPGVRADHDGGVLRRRGSRALLRPRRRAARRRGQPPHAAARGRRDGAAGGRGPGNDQGREVRRLSLDPRRRPGALRPRPVRRLPRDRRRCQALQNGDLRRRCAWTSTTGAGRACRSSSARASSCR